MKKRYTKKQIQESIRYWQKQLNENTDIYAGKDIPYTLKDVYENFTGIIDAIEDKYPDFFCRV